MFLLLRRTPSLCVYSPNGGSINDKVLPYGVFKSNLWQVSQVVTDF